MSRVPLKFLAFERPTSVPGTDIMMTTVVPMEARLVGGLKFVCPQPFLDEEKGVVVIEDREYPMIRVHYYERAKAAKSKPQEVSYDQYTIGKREARRIKISVEDRQDLGPVFKPGKSKD